MLLNEEIAEFCGALAGDGCLSEYFVKSEKRLRYEVVFTGSVSDFPYYKEFLQPALLKYFNMNGRLFFRGGNSTRFHIKSRAVFNYFKSLGFPIGEKGNDLGMPFHISEKSSITQDKKAFVLRINNQENIKKYLNSIRFSNMHHLHRIQKMLG